MARAGLYRGAHETVLWPPPGCVAGVPCRVAACTLALLHAMSQHVAAVSLGVSRHTPTTKSLPSCHDTIICIVTRFANQKSRLSRYKDCIVTQPPAARPLSPVTIQCFVSRHSPHQPGCAHTLSIVSRALRAVLWSILGSVVAEPWPYRGLSPMPPCLLCYPVSRYKNCIVTQTGKRGSSPSSFVYAAFFFFFFSQHTFFFSFQLLENHQRIYIYIYIYIYFIFQ